MSASRRITEARSCLLPAAVLLLALFAGEDAIACDFDACVGSGEISTIAQAIEAGRGRAAERWEVFVPAGEYREKLVIEVPAVTLVGEGQGETVIHYDAYAGQQQADGSGPWTTWGSATLIVRAEDFAVRDLSIENRFDYPANDALPGNHPGKIRDAQAVALMLDRGSDRALFERVSIEGYQDTLFVQAGRSLFRDSLISGNVDFIFGAGTALFAHSEIRMRSRRSEQALAGYLTAASTDISEPYGLVFIDCRLTREAGVADGSTSLGRPWHPTTTFPDGRYADPDAIGAVAFIDSWMDGHIVAAGWSSMQGRAKTGGKTEFPPREARFFEFGNRGPGSQANAARRQLDAAQAGKFAAENLLGDWRPRVPLPLPLEPAAYSPANELRKHAGRWPQIRLAELTPDAAVSVESNVVYAGIDGRQLLADVFFPVPVDARTYPGVVLVHGGGWRSGQRDYLAPFAQALAAAGFVAMTVEYRLSREALYPAGLEDIQRALAWMREAGEKYGLDPRRIALLGTSAGAHLASLAAVTDSRPDDVTGAAGRVQALVNIDGVVDLTSPEARTFEDAPHKPSAFGLWIGGRYADYPGLWREASPLTHVGANSPPTLFINSSQARFHAGREDFTARLSDHGVASEVHTIADTPHTFWLFEPWFSQAVRITAGFLLAQLGAANQ